MLLREFSLEFKIPNGWECQSGGGRIVAHGPSGEELIVSGSMVVGAGGRKDLERARRALIENAFTAVRDAADDPSLVVTEDLAREAELTACDIWTLECRTSDEEVYLGEAVAATDKAVMIVTLEAPNVPSSRAKFRDFLQSIHESDSQ